MLHEAKCKIKEITEKFSNNMQLETKAIDKKIAGNVLEKVGQIKKALGK